MESIDFRELAEQYKPAIDKINLERQSIGLETIAVDVGVFMSGQIHGVADKDRIYLNVFYNLADMPSDVKNKIISMGAYFDSFRPYHKRMSMANDMITYRLATGELEFKENEFCHLKPAVFQEIKASFRQNSQRIGGLFDIIKEWLPRAVNEKQAGFICHEIEHESYRLKHVDEFEYADWLYWKGYDEGKCWLEAENVNTRLSIETEARAFFLERFREVNYNKDKIDNIVGTVMDDLNGYAVSQFLKMTIRRHSFEEGMKRGLDRSEIEETELLIKCWMGIDFYPEQRISYMKRYPESIHQRIAPVNARVQRKMIECQELCAQEVEKLVEFYKDLPRIEA